MEEQTTACKFCTTNKISNKQAIYIFVKLEQKQHWLGPGKKALNQLSAPPQSIHEFSSCFTSHTITSYGTLVCQIKHVR